MPFAKQSKNNQEIESLIKIAQEIRIKIIEMITLAQSGHPAGSLGMADIFTALYFKLLNHQPEQPNWPQRDYVILSNGHICPVLYATLAKAGYFSQEQLLTLRQINSLLQGHPQLGTLPGIETSSGPLGQGLSQANGLALALSHDQKINHVFCLLSDGEQQEGQTWEAYLLAAKYQLANLTVIIDRNQIQIEGKTETIMPLENLKNKISSFGWQVYETDGHDFTQIIKTVTQAKKDNLPSAIIAHTIPGKGVSFMENKNEWHGQAPTPQEAELAIKQLQSQIETSNQNLSS